MPDAGYLYCRANESMYVSWESRNVTVKSVKFTKSSNKVRVSSILTPEFAWSSGAVSLLFLSVAVVYVEERSLVISVYLTHVAVASGENCDLYN